MSEQSKDEIVAALFARIDFELANHGSISLLTAKTAAAEAWLRANIVINEETQFWGAALPGAPATPRGLPAAS